MLNRRAVLPASVLLTLALVYLIAWATVSSGPGAATGSAATDSAATGSAATGSAATGSAATGSAAKDSAATAPVTAVTRDCPPAGPGESKPHLAMHAAPAPAGPKAQPAASAPAPGQAAIPPASGSGSAGTEVSASGQMAQGFEAEQADSGGTGLVTCAHPGSDMWFVGTGTQAGGSTTWLYLMNTGAMPASADVTVVTDAGVQSDQDNQVTVPPRRSLGVNIASQARGSAALAVHVQVSSGQVGADMWQDGGSGGAWLPEAASPATDLVLPGVTETDGTAKLLVSVPGQQDAQVRVTALTARGTTKPLGTASQDVPGGATSSIPLNSLGGPAAALVISSSVPVTAGVQIPGSGIGTFTAAAAPVTEQGVVAGNPSGGGNTVDLSLSAPGTGTRVAISVLAASNAGGGATSPQQTVTVQSGHTALVTVDPPKGSSGPFAVVVTPLPGSGPLYAARTVTSGGTLKAVIPVPSAPWQIQLPPASQNYSAVLP